MKKTQKGFGTLEVFLGAAIIALVASLGWYLSSKNSNITSTNFNVAQNARDAKLAVYTYKGFKFNFYEGSTEGDAPGTVGYKSLISPAKSNGDKISFDFSQRAAASSNTFKSCPIVGGKNTLVFSVETSGMSSRANVCRFSATDYWVFIPTTSYNYSFEFKLAGKSSSSDLSKYSNDLKSMVSSIQLQ